MSVEIFCEMEDVKFRGSFVISSFVVSIGGGIRRIGESQRAVRVRGLCAEAFRRRGVRWFFRGGGVLWCCGGVYIRLGFYRRGFCFFCNFYIQFVFIFQVERYFKDRSWVIILFWIQVVFRSLFCFGRFLGYYFFLVFVLVFFIFY